MQKEKTNKKTLFVLNLVVGKSELQVQSKKCSACQGLELVEKIASVLLLQSVW